MGDVDASDTDLKYIKVMAEHPDPVFSAPEIADMVDVTQQAAYDRLSSMHERGLVSKKMVGARAAVWWLSTDGIEAYKESET